MRGTPIGISGSGYNELGSDGKWYRHYTETTVQEMAPDAFAPQSIVVEHPQMLELIRLAGQSVQPVPAPLPLSWREKCRKTGGYIKDILKLWRK